MGGELLGRGTTAPGIEAGGDRCSLSLLHSSAMILSSRHLFCGLSRLLILLLFLLTASAAYAQPPGAPITIYAGMGEGAANPALVRTFVFGRQTAASEFFAFGSSYGCSVASGNIDGGVTSEILAGPGPAKGAAPEGRAFREDGTPIPAVNFLAYGTVGGGLRLAAGLIDQDPFDEILTAPGPLAPFGPHVRGFDLQGGRLAAMPGLSFYAYQTLHFGCHPAAGNLDLDPLSEILTAPGPGPVFAPEIRGFRYRRQLLSVLPRVDFQAFAASGYGAEVSAGDADQDGMDEIAAGPGPAATLPRTVRLFDADKAPIAAVPGFRLPPGQGGYGAKPAFANLARGDDRDEIAVAAGPDPNAAAAIAGYRYDGTSALPLQPILDPFPGARYGSFPAGGEAPRKLRCNGKRYLCERPYNEACEVCTHNAMSNMEDGFVIPTPNQRYSFERQLDDGVRCMMLDTYWYQGAPALCHAICGLGFTPFVPMLKNLRLWLEDHPRQIVTFILEASITEAETEQALVDGNVFGLVYHHAAPPGSPWPTLRQMLERDARLVVFTDDANANGDWHLDWRLYGFETPYDDSTFTCAHGRGDPTRYDNQIFILNNYLLCKAGGCEQNGALYNRYSFLYPRAARCWRLEPVPTPFQIPTFLNVDHYHLPDPGDQGPRPDVFEVQDSLNDAWPTPP